MTYEIEFKPKAIKDLKSINKNTSRKIIEKIEELGTDLAGDVKRLTDFTPEYRLRVGDYRVLFEFEGNTIVIFRVKHRSDAYNP